MITINENFKAKKYSGGWELHRLTSYAEDGTPRWDVTFHRDLVSLSKAAIDKGAPSEGGLQDLIDHVNNSTSLLTIVLTGVNNG